MFAPKMARLLPLLLLLAGWAAAPLHLTHTTQQQRRQQQPRLSPRLTKMRTLIAGAQLGVGCDVQDPSPMISDPQTGLWHFWSVYGCGGTCGWAGQLRHWYSNSTDLESATFLDGGQALNHSANPNALDSNGQFSPAIIYDTADSRWFLFYSATGKNGSAARRCIGEPTGCTSSQMVASSASPHGPWRKLGVVARAMHDGSWNEILVDSGRALLISGVRGFYGIGFVSKTRWQAGHVLDVEGVYRPQNASSFAPPYQLGVPLNTTSDTNSEG
jgi:hypothetical protein